MLRLCSSSSNRIIFSSIERSICSIKHSYSSTSEDSDVKLPSVVVPSKYASKLKVALTAEEVKPKKNEELSDFEELQSYVDISIEKEADYVMSKFVGRLTKRGEKAKAQQVVLKALLHIRELKKGDITALK
mmetsp:Transcript_20660/g.37024  ORF Transcript_20660/g.37024 Transcript_20660/m.37024 type:complete len:131 (-) Transcript_20660:172-564(-)|eukprot:CAMPEP_0175066986 /NCGR_PEP_ID=MMETSP0052_2-20121109/16829_1 /TAXON_ID=51329 ORGANISM="Polytomella parva, Strain SAG 63-3" /NCGR_SAMPLE_ID=MMETSP0052_2 /ASSEMBLY_ACC=CAM_ASM_000194 /LENGTH=130 /DNA_ID=CAMNT_0016333781 /DNA_START=62 /DNA_END=454 /DNA_ORIENTATION=+